MPQNVFVPAIGKNLQFPDGMSQDAMRDAIYSNFPQAKPPLMTRAADAVTGAVQSALPAVTNEFNTANQNWHNNTQGLQGIQNAPLGIADAIGPQVISSLAAIPAAGWAIGQGLNAGTQALGAAITGNPDQAPNPVEATKDAFHQAQQFIAGIPVPGGDAKYGSATIGQLETPLTQPGQQVNQGINNALGYVPNKLGSWAQNLTGSQTVGDLANAAGQVGESLLLGKVAGALGDRAAYINEPNGTRTIDGEWGPGSSAPGAAAPTPNTPAPFNPGNFDPRFAGWMNPQSVDATVTGSGPFNPTVNALGNSVPLLRAPIKGLPNYPENPAGEGPIISGPAQPPITQGNQLDLMKSGTTSQLSVSPMGAQMITKLEGGMKPTAYDDGFGNMTIGIGHMLPKAYDPAKPVPQAKLDQWFQQDLTNAQNLVRKAINPNVQLTQPQFDALTSLAFNLKSKSFLNSDVVKFVNQGNMQAAANAFATLNHANGQVVPGLTARRSAEAQLFSQSPAGGNTFNASGFYATATGLQQPNGQPVQADSAQGIDVNQLINQQWPQQSAMSITDQGMAPGAIPTDSNDRQTALAALLQQPIAEGSHQTLADVLFPQNAQEIVHAATRNPNMQLMDLINSQTGLDRAQGLQGAAAKAKQKMYDKLGNEQVPYTNQTVGDILFPQQQQPAQQQIEQQPQTNEGIAPTDNRFTGQVVQGGQQTQTMQPVQQVRPAPVRIGTKRGASTIDRERDSISMAVAKLGGLKLSDLNGDLTEANGKPLRLPKSLGGNGVAFLAHNGKMAKAPDKMREALAEQGYLPHGSTIDDMVSRINDEVHSDEPRHYSLAYNNQSEVDHHYQQQQEIEDEKKQLELTADQALADPKFTAGILINYPADVDAAVEQATNDFFTEHGEDYSYENVPFDTEGSTEEPEWLTVGEALANPDFKAGFLTEENTNASNGNTAAAEHSQSALSNEKQSGQAASNTAGQRSEGANAGSTFHATSAGQQSNPAGSANAQLLSGNGEPDQSSRVAEERNGNTSGRRDQRLQQQQQQPAGELKLTHHTEQSLALKERELELKRQELELQQRELEQRMQADNLRNSFQLTGSDRPADSNPNQDDMLGNSQDQSKLVAEHRYESMTEPERVQYQEAYRNQDWDTAERLAQSSNDDVLHNIWQLIQERGTHSLNFAGIPGSKALYRAIRGLFAQKRNGQGEIAGATEAIARTLFYTPVGNIRDIDTPTARTLANMFFAPVTRTARDNPTPPDLISRTNRKLGHYGKQLEDALEHLKPTGTIGAAMRFGYKLNKAQNLALFRALETGTTPSGLKYTVQGIRDLFKEIHADMKSAGLDVGEIENYFPHVYDDEKISNDMQGFIQDLMNNGYSQQTAENVARRIVDGEGVIDWRNQNQRPTATDWEYWKHNMVTDEWKPAPEPQPFRPQRAGDEKGGTSKQVFERSRKLDLPVHVLEKWLVTDVESVAARYIRKAVDRMEYARMFGKSEMKLNKMATQILAENAAKPFKDQLPVQEILNRIYGLADAVQHKYKPILSPEAASVNRKLANYEIMLHMGFVALASVSEIAAPAIHHGFFLRSYLKGVGVAFHEAARSVDRLLLNGKLSESILDELPVLDHLKELGLIKTHAMNAESRFYGQGSKATQAFMRHTLLEELTNIQRVIAHDSIQRVIRRNAKALAKGNIRAAKERMYRKQLIEYGINPDEAIAWYRGGMKDQSFADKADFASVRWVHRTITEPNAATKPLRFSNPHLRLQNLFQSFQSVFSNVFMKKFLNDLASRDVTMGRKLGIIGGIVGMMAFALFSLYMRQKANGTWDDTKSVAALVWDSIDRAGLDAQGSYAYNILSPYKNGLPDVMERAAGVVLGPLAGDIARNITGLAKGLKSGDYSDFERELAKDVPILNNFISLKKKQ